MATRAGTPEPSTKTSRTRWPGALGAIRSDSRGPRRRRERCRELCRWRPVGWRRGRGRRNLRRRLHGRDGPGLWGRSDRTAEGRGVGESVVESFAAGVLLDGDEGGDAGTFDEDFTDAMARGFGGDQIGQPRAAA